MDKNMCPDCVWVEMENKAKHSTVKAYSLKTECSACKTKRSALASAMETQRVEEEYQARKAKLIKDRADELAIIELKKDGVLDEDGEIIESELIN